MRCCFRGLPLFKMTLAGPKFELSKFRALRVENVSIGRKASTPLFVAMHLDAAGLDLGHVVEMTTYDVGLRKHLKTLIKVKDEFIKPPYPAWTAVGVTEPITEGVLLEIRVIAKRD